MPESRIETTEDRLIEATILSLHRYGQADTTVATITEIAGLSRGMVRHCFASKNAMMVAAAEHLLSKWTEKFLEQRKASHRDSVLAMVGSLFDPDNFDEFYISAWLAFLEASIHHQELRQITNAEYDKWQASISDEISAYALESGKDLDAGRIASTVLSLSDGVWIRHALDPDKVRKIHARDLCLDLVRDLLDFT